MEIKFNGEVNPTKAAWAFLAAGIVVTAAKVGIEVYGEQLKQKVKQTVKVKLVEEPEEVETDN